MASTVERIVALLSPIGYIVLTIQVEDLIQHPHQKGAYQI
jgi:hypothetical protein